VRILCLQDKNGETALHIASENGHASIVGLLLKVGAGAQEIDEKSKAKSKHDS
jgi:ankyrin repeat protein